MCVCVRVCVCVIRVYSSPGKSLFFFFFLSSSFSTGVHIGKCTDFSL